MEKPKTAFPHSHSPDYWINIKGGQRDFFVYQNLTRSLLLLPTALLATIWVSLNPFFDHAGGIQSIIGRLDILAFVPVALIVPVITVILGETSRKIALLAAIIFCSLLLWSTAGLPYPAGLRKDFLITRERLDKDLPQFSVFLCSNPVILAPHGVQFHVSRVLRVPSQQLPASVSKFECTLWLINQENRYSLIEDSEFRLLLTHLNSEERRQLANGNPHLQDLLGLR